MTRQTWRLWICGLALAGGFAAGAYWTVAAAWIGAGFFAKQLCSGVFVSGRAPDEVAADDLRLHWPPFLFHTIDWSVDRPTVTASWFGIVRRHARYRDGLGCTLVYPTVAQNGGAAAGAVLRNNLPHHVTNPRVRLTQPAPVVSQRADTPAAESAGRLPILDAARLRAAVDEAFDEPHPEHPRRTRAVVVVHAGRIVAEGYAAGFSTETRFPGGSLTKSVVNALIGALAYQGRLRVSDRVPIEAWRRRNDPRHAITFDHLLRMSSGLQFDEAHDSPFSDVTRMLYGVPDASAFAAMKPLVAPPGTVWSYASGTTNVLSAALRAFARRDLPYEEMPRRLLFDRLGMTSAVIETDQRGNLLGSSSMFATARDWARFGWLFAADGVWDGERILPPGWVAYSATPAPADPGGRYGAHFWRYHAEERARAREVSLAEIPGDAFFAAGVAGQRITIIPSRALVIVRIGHTLDRSAFNNAGFVARVLETLEPSLAGNRTYAWPRAISERS